MKTILNGKQLAITIDRLCHQLIENHLQFENTVLIGLQPRGIYLGDRIYETLKKLLPGTIIHYGKLDITFYRDDYNKGKTLHVPSETNINFSIENKKVVLIDDVLYTGRTIRSALDAMLDFGRPASVELLALIDRRFSRQLPIQPDYTGRTIDALISQKVRVLWEQRDGKDEVILVD
ncbi:bifunctional pyr operon transcriptional regulator/uracil phosphoribosyltransferase PyrR [Chitinophaga varians]|uniref:Bifunctional pyr operon transcriptional regulator/uracil phosphoribosyltransferase PyrR n=1 Tax=Chitinophaga varians TaxID=2202339 RepID=A0A847RN02_9BACT|nr:bifunctional pyr operon transcriptional regulator/uracil phosphoribosyltransferase PyrR [Chitinophaga varians]NLR68369.1 bifunctional pyr operon transcriptional regulator/uracil phosphoribosyltransferase PyrR [Chitinophaga varians]